MCVYHLQTKITQQGGIHYIEEDSPAHLLLPNGSDSFLASGRSGFKVPCRVKGFESTSFFHEEASQLLNYGPRASICSSWSTWWRSMHECWGENGSMQAGAYVTQWAGHPPETQRILAFACNAIYVTLANWLLPFSHLHFWIPRSVFILSVIFAKTANPISFSLFFYLFS